jgi:hypothetical protein
VFATSLAKPWVLLVETVNYEQSQIEYNKRKHNNLGKVGPVRPFIIYEYVPVELYHSRHRVEKNDIPMLGQDDIVDTVKNSGCEKHDGQTGLNDESQVRKERDDGCNKYADTENQNSLNEEYQRKREPCRGDRRRIEKEKYQQKCNNKQMLEGVLQKDLNRKKTLVYIKLHHQPLVRTNAAGRITHRSAEPVPGSKADEKESHEMLSLSIKENPEYHIEQTQHEYWF